MSNDLPQERDTADQHAPEPSAPWIIVAIRPAGRRVVIVGSGAVARRRAEQFASRGARVEIYDPNLATEKPADLPPEAVLFERAATRNDIAGAWLVVVATSDAAVNAEVGQWTTELDINCNRTDDADAGTFAMPALLEDDHGWKVAVLGGEAGPLFSAWVKGLVGQMAAREQIDRVYMALASARRAAEELSISQKDRAFLLRRVMAKILEIASDEDGAQDMLHGAALVHAIAKSKGWS